VQAAMLVGHNPETSEFVRRLTGEAVDLSTCAVAECRIDVERWAELDDAQNRSPAVLLRLDTPEK
jgi:phosphohistidine phosphatase